MHSRVLRWREQVPELPAEGKLRGRLPALPPPLTKQSPESSSTTAEKLGGLRGTRKTTVFTTPAAVVIYRDTELPSSGEEEK